MNNTQEIKESKLTNDNAGKTYTDPITGKFKEGNPGGGRPPGSKNFATDFDEAVEEIAKANNITLSEARKILFRKAYAQAKDGDFPYYKDIMDRYYGKAKESFDFNGKVDLFIHLDSDIARREHVTSSESKDNSA